MSSAARFSYWLRGNLYISVSNRLNSLPFIKLRGPSFQLPEFQSLSLPNSLDSSSPSYYEPNVQEIVELVDNSYNENKIQINSMKSESITFAGYGDPLFRLDEICQAVQLVHEQRHGVPFRIKTSGLFDEPELIANQLFESRIKHVSVPLLSDNPRQYSEIIQPLNSKHGFHTVCNFIVACVERNLTVTCTAVERPDVNISRVRSLSQSLGAPLFETYSYHP